MAKNVLPWAIGQRVMLALTTRGVSQSNLAKTLGVTRAAVGQWKSGDTSPSSDNLVRISEILNVSFEWLGTGRGNMDVPSQSAEAPVFNAIPLVSWVSAGQLIDSQTQIPPEKYEKIALGDLGSGDFFALRVMGDSMNRVSPEGSIVAVNRSERELITDKPYIFSYRGETAYKLWQPDPPHLAPNSTYPNKPIFIKRKKDLEVVGRVRRTVLDL